jgi:translation initiation factor 5
MGRPGAIVNISGLTPVDDPEYRYKMPTVYGKIEGKGNGIKTVIPNISDVGLALKREAGEVNKFFGCELGAQTTYNADTDRAVVNGAHDDRILQQMMHKYIELFVLCPNCRLPETEYKIKSGAIYHKCMACGSKDMVDMSHKLCTYILSQDKKVRLASEVSPGGRGRLIIYCDLLCSLLFSSYFAQAKQDAKKSGKKDKDKKDKKKEKKDGSGSDEEKKKEKVSI